ncbi:hypothetical protein FO519_004919 [Halicephalobus sp. NKZ332]|nr:hypothetical protein FO519_004919 [Halicephalobus sp. NKZ332]
MIKPQTIIPDGKNPFKWVSFNEQISRLNAGVVSSRLKLLGESLDQETHFFAAVTAWNDKDYGDDYRAFLDDIPYDELASYAQLLHYKDEIFEALQYHLSIENSKAYPALLDIAISFVVDLKEDFFPFLWAFFDTVIALLERTRADAVVLDVGFKALANLFQIHWRTVTKSLRKVFVRFSPLFGSSTVYIRRFAAEAFSFLLRKSQAIPKLCQFLYEQAHEADKRHIKDGISQLLFNGIKGVHKQFQSRTAELLKDFIQSAMDLEDQAVRDTAMEILVNVMTLCCQWTSVEYSKDVTSVVMNLFGEQINRKSPESQLKILLNLIIVWITTKKGNNFTQQLELLETLKGISAKPGLQQLDYVFLNVVSKTLCTYLSKFSDPGTIRQIIAGGCLNYLQEVNVATVSSVFSFLQSILNLGIFDIWCTSSVAKVLDLIIESPGFNDDLLRPILKFFAVYTIKRRPFLEGVSEERKPFFDTSCFSKFREQVIQKVKALLNSFDDLGIYSLVVYPWLWGTWSEIPDAFLDMKKLMNQLLSSPSSSERTAIVTYLLVYNVELLDCSCLKSLGVDDALKYLKAHDVHDEFILRTAFKILSISEEVPKVDHLSKLEEFSTALKSGMLSPSGSTRRWILKILNVFDSYLQHGHVDERGQFVSSESALSILLQAEETPSNMSCYRTRGSYLRKLSFNLFERMFPEGCSNELKKIPLTLVIAQLFERFTPLWPMAHDIVKDYVKLMKFEDFWEVFQRALDLAKREIYEEMRLDEVELNEMVADEVKNDIFDFCKKPKGDFFTFRTQLFQMLIHFPGYAKRNDQYMVDTLIDIYQEEYFLLRGSVPELQQAAFNCFLSYRYPFLNPYAEYFNALFDKKKFHNGIIHFSIDESNSAVESTHRSELIPYLMKVLNGQLMVKGYSYKTKTVIIMNHLAGSTSSELDVFFDEIFGLLMEYTKLKRNINEQKIEDVCNFSEEYDFTNTLSPRRLSRLVSLTN